jgi:antiviral helicase SKI2
MDVDSILNVRKIATMNNTKADLLQVLEEWIATGSIPEVNWKNRVRALEFQEILRMRDDTIQRLPTHKCKECPEFDDHVCSLHILFPPLFVFLCRTVLIFT